MAVTAADLSVHIGADTGDAERGFERVQGLMGGLGGIARTATLGLIGIGAGLAGAAAVGVKSAGDLQQSVANISTIKPDIDTSAVFASLNEMQTRVPQSAKQLGDSLYDIFSSVEVSQKDALGLVETFAKGAVGAGTDAKTFGTSVLGVMNAYGLAAEDATHVSDVFFNTVNKGVVTGEELAASLGPVTQSAKAAGVSLDELGGFIAGVTKEGGPAAQNVNNLNNFFQKVTTKEAQAAMHDLGVATVDATGKFRPTTAVLDDLKGKLGGMTEAARANALQAIFPDAQARIGAQTLLSQLDFVKDAIADNTAQAGSAEAAYAKMSATFNSQWQLLQNTFGSIVTTLGAELLPAITPLVSAIAKDLPGAFASLRAAAQPVVDFFQSTLLPVLGTLGDAARQALSGDLGGALASVEGLIAGLLPKIVAQLGAWGKAFVDWVGPMIPPLLGNLVELWRAVETWIVTTALPQLVETLAGWAAAFLDWVGPQIAPLLRELGNMLSALGAWLGETGLPLLVSKLSEWGASFVAWIGPRIGPMLTELGTLLAELGGWMLTTALPNIVSKLLEWGAAFVNWIALDVLPNLPGALATVAEALNLWITATATSILGWAVNLGKQLIAGFLNGLATLGAELRAAIVGQIKAALPINIGPFHLTESGFSIDQPPPIEITTITRNIVETVERAVKGRASGGPVFGGVPYIVGEVGPELFVPNGSGTIVPNRALGGGGLSRADLDYLADRIVAGVERVRPIVQVADIREGLQDYGRRNATIFGGVSP